jgi:hypothetical protein
MQVDDTLLGTIRKVEVDMVILAVAMVRASSQAGGVQPRRGDAGPTLRNGPKTPLPHPWGRAPRAPGVPSTVQARMRASGGAVLGPAVQTQRASSGG